MWPSKWLGLDPQLALKSTNQGWPPATFPPRAWLCPSRCCLCCSFRFLRLLFFSHLSRSSPLGDVGLSAESDLAGKKSISYLSKWKVRDIGHFSTLGNTKHIVYISRAGLSERTLRGYLSQDVTRIWFLMLPCLLPETAASTGPFQKWTFIAKLHPPPEHGTPNMVFGRSIPHWISYSWALSQILGAVSNKIIQPAG